MQSKKPIPAIPGFRSEPPNSQRCCTQKFYGIIRKIPNGQTATGSSCRQGTDLCSCMPRCILPVTIFRLTISARSGKSVPAAPDIPNTASPPALKPLPGRSVRAFLPQSGWRLPKRCLQRGSTPKSTALSITTPTRWWEKAV